MARKSKRLIINEAIRQGQAKIAEGLKTGQMRSDRAAPEDKKEDGKSVVEIGQPATRQISTDFFKSKELPGKYGSFITRINTTVVIYAASVMFLGLVVWIILSVGGNDKGAPQIERDFNSGGIADMSDEMSGEQDTAKNPSSFFSGGTDESSRLTGSDDEAVLAGPGVSSGDNVIWIQSIAANRKDELVPVAKFFGRKGIETEIIIGRDSGNAGLVTKAGFEENPGSRGTEGYELLKRIRQIGPVYVEETNDTKFGMKPFQDAYGYKRR